MSLVTSGMVTTPSAPMLLINGLNDTQVPTRTCMCCCAWLARGGQSETAAHGPFAQASDQRIFETVTLPWVVPRADRLDALIRTGKADATDAHRLRRAVPGWLDVRESSGAAAAPGSS
jgi:hypothetical protein